MKWADKIRSHAGIRKMLTHTFFHRPFTESHDLGLSSFLALSGLTHWNVFTVQSLFFSCNFNQTVLPNHQLGQGNPPVQEASQITGRMG